MNKKVANRIERIGSALESWLRPDNERLNRAIERSVDEGLFSLPDVHHRLRSLKRTMTTAALGEWSLCLPDDFDPGSGSSILNFHPGNLPLCGIEDLLASLLTGAKYCGKLSRRDPWLPSSFLEELKERGVDGLMWSSNSEELNDTCADALIFSGAAQSLPGIASVTERLRLVQPNAPHLIRRAAFSIAWLDSGDQKSLRDLVNAVFRYGGDGCRSVALVVAPFHLDEHLCHMTDAIEEFWLHSPQHKRPDPALYYRYAANKALGLRQAWLDHFLIEESDRPPGEQFMLHWVCGQASDVARLAQKFAPAVQSIYCNNADCSLPGLAGRTELLCKAQDPPLNWRPDGIDTLAWLIENLKVQS
ncbi:MAG: hypothetical protein WDZ29_03595 [Balneolaceae bacterium]